MTSARGCRVAAARFKKARTAYVCARVLLFVCLPSVAAQSPAEHALHGFISLGTSDIYRGLQRNQKDLSLQAELRWTISEAFFAGAHASQAEFVRPNAEVSGYTELDYHVGWRRSLGDNSALQLRLGRHTYPDASDAIEYDYDQFAVGIELASSVAVSITLQNYSLPIADDGGAMEISWRSAIGKNLEASAALGGARYFGSPRPGYGYWDVGVSTPLGPITADLRYHYSPRSTRWFGREPAHGMWVLSLTAGW